jgi:hypothetical protein
MILSPGETDAAGGATDDGEAGRQLSKTDPHLRHGDAKPWEGWRPPEVERLVVTGIDNGGDQSSFNVVDVARNAHPGRE